MPIPSSRYNSIEHPVAFHKAVDLGRAPKKIAAAGPVPDLEEAFEVGVLPWCSGRCVDVPLQVDEELPEEPEEKANDDEDDITQDSLIKRPKGSRAGGSSAKGKAKAKK